MIKYLTIIVISSLVIGKARADPPIFRPDVTNGEDADFWNKYAEQDLNRMNSVWPNYGLAKNVIILVGDGMGITSNTLSRMFKGQKAGRTGEEEELAWETMPVTGLSKTYNTDYQVADSAGTATALFSGVKTRLAYLGVSSEPKRGECDTETYEKSKLKTMLDWSQEAGKSTGIISTARITHATPGALYSKVTDRDFEADSNFPEKSHCMDIAEWLIYGESGQNTNVVMGGGLRNFLPKNAENPSESGKRTDGKNLVEEYLKIQNEKGRNAAVFRSASDFEEWKRNGFDKDYILGLFNMKHLSYEVDRNPALEPSLTEMAEAAIEKLSQNEKGFFLMVESGRIDHAHHENNAFRAMEESVEFDKTVNMILNHPKFNKEETLIIVTADHSHAVTMSGYPERGTNVLGYVFDTDEKSGLFSRYGDTKVPYPIISYANGGPGFTDHIKTSDNDIQPWKDLRDFDFRDKDYHQPAMVPGPHGYETHGGEDVAIFAQGPMAHLLSGVHEQNYIAHVMAYSACVGRYDKSDCRGNRYSGRSGASSLKASATLALAFISSFIMTLTIY